MPSRRFILDDAYAELNVLFVLFVLDIEIDVDNLDNLVFDIEIDLDNLDNLVLDDHIEIDDFDHHYNFVC